MKSSQAAVQAAVARGRFGELSRSQRHMPTPHPIMSLRATGMVSVVGAGGADLSTLADWLAVRACGLLACASPFCLRTLAVRAARRPPLCSASGSPGSAVGSRD